MLENPWSQQACGFLFLAVRFFSCISTDRGVRRRLVGGTGARPHAILRSITMALGSLEVVDPSISLARTLDEFEETLQDVSFVDVEDRHDAVSSFKDTSKNSLESFLQSLNQQVSFQQEGILRLATFFHLIRPWNSPSEASISKGNPSALFGVLKATLIAGHRICGDLVTVIAKLDQLSQRTSKIRGEELELVAEEVVQSLLVQLASFVVQTCTKILRLSEFF